MNQLDTENVTSDEMNPPVKNKKTTLLWQVLFLIFGSSLAVYAFFVDSGILGIFVYPTLYVLPFAFKKPKLLFIPYVVSVILLILLYIFNDFLFGQYVNFKSPVPVLAVVFAFLSILGIAIGLAITARRRGRAIATIIAVIMVLSPITYFIIGVTDNPFKNHHAQQKIDAYVAANYPEYEWDISKPQYAGTYGYYTSTVVAKNDEHIHFDVTLFYKGGFSDTYNEVIVYFLTSILQKEFGDDFVEVRVQRGGASTNLSLSSEYATIKLHVRDLALQNLVEAMIRCRSVIEQNNYSFTTYSFQFISDNGETRNINNLKAESIKEDLSSLLRP